MNRLIPIQRLVILFFIFLTHGAVSAEEAKIYFHPETMALQPGETGTLTLFVENIPPVYGVELGFAFNPDVVEVTADIDEKKSRVQLEDGDFLEHKKAMTLQNQADNSTGTINYVKTLLNPASPVQGSGELVRITLKAKQIGTASFRITKAKFGTKKGRVIVPDYHPDLNVLVSDRLIDTVDKKKLFLIVALVLVLIVVIIALLKRRKFSSKEKSM